MSSATGVGQAIVLLAAPILTRLYQPDDFGVLGVYASALGIIAVIASLRYEQAIPLPRSGRVAINVFALALLVVILSSALLAVVAFFLGPQIARLTNTTAQAFAIYLVPLGVALVGTYQVLSYWAVRQQAYGRIAQSTLVQGAGSVTVQLVFGFLGAGAPGLVAGQIVGKSAGITTLARVVRRASNALPGAISLKNLRRVSRRYRRFPLILSWSALLNSIGLMGPTVVLAGIYGAAVVGWYALVQRILGAPTSLLGRSVTKVYFSESARLARDAPGQLQRLFLRVVKKLLLLGCLTIVPIGLLSPWAFSFVFGAEWANAGRYALILSPMMLLQFVSSPFGVTLTVLERQDLAILREIIRVVLIACALAAATIGSYPPEIAMILLSLAGTVSYVAHLGISWFAIGQRSSATESR